MAKLENALEARELELQALPCLAAENATLRKKVSRLKGFDRALD